MTSNHPESVSEAPQKLVLHKLGTNLYRLHLRGDKPGKPSGPYYALLKRGGKQFRRSLKTRDRKLAERRLADLRHKVCNLTISDDSKLSFKEIADRWLASIRHTMKPASVNRLEKCIKGLEPFFRGVTVRNIKREHCEAWLTKRGPSLAASSFNHELDTMRGVLAYAVDLGLLLDNPALKLARATVRREEIQVPTRDEFVRLVAAIRQSDGRADSQAKAAPGADLVELLAYSGMRLREATSLRWSDVDFDKNILTVRGPEGVGTKNSEVRVIPMTDALRGLLLRLRDQRPAGAEDPISTIADAKTTVRKACKRLGLPPFCHHDFRHFFATTCIESGVDIPTISRWLGHKDGGALAMRVYGHLRTEHSFAQIKRVSFEPVTNVVPMAQPPSGTSPRETTPSSSQM